ncbi:hypothetical protein Salat_1590800 [Sesamum alatum]|uniref:Uncharacterized protein n=1 Tax=Sesamum alatum TaxID=300844 RepID=A0AAE1Y618_9LAMI|nr:hypothetical protein Salat_1590800 [Sesamum alatum]
MHSSKFSHFSPQLDLPPPPLPADSPQPPPSRRRRRAATGRSPEKSQARDRSRAPPESTAVRRSTAPSSACLHRSSTRRQSRSEVTIFAIKSPRKSPFLLSNIPTSSRRVAGHHWYHLHPCLRSHLSPRSISGSVHTPDWAFKSPVASLRQRFAATGTN